VLRDLKQRGIQAPVLTVADAARLLGGGGGGVRRANKAMGAKRPSSCPSVQGHAKRTLLAFFDFPAQHWKHLRTSNPIESSFATVQLRQRVTKGAGRRAKALTDGVQAADAGPSAGAAQGCPHLIASARRCVACDARTTRWVPQDAQVLDKLPSVQGHAKP
jgi:hypothetical protein